MRRYTPEPEAQAPAKTHHYVGERIRVRPVEFFDGRKDRDGIVEVDDEIFLPEMSAYCSLEGRITSLDPFGSFLINLDKGECGWSGGMFEDSI